MPAFGGHGYRPVVGRVQSSSMSIACHRVRLGGRSSGSSCRLLRPVTVEPDEPAESREGIMAIPEALDLTGPNRDARELSSCSHHTVAVDMTNHEVCAAGALHRAPESPSGCSPNSSGKPQDFGPWSGKSGYGAVRSCAKLCEVGALRRRVSAVLVRCRFEMARSMATASSTAPG